jgi:anti-anti-sigma regulatory factor
MAEAAAPLPLLRLDSNDGGQILHLHGAWTLGRLEKLEQALDGITADPLRSLVLDASSLEQLDSAGA